MFSFTLPRGCQSLSSSNRRSRARHSTARCRHKPLGLEALEPRLSLSGQGAIGQFAAGQPLPVTNLALVTPLPQAAVAASLPQGPAGDQLAAVVVLNQVTQASAAQQQAQSGYNPLGQYPFDPFAEAVTQDSFTDLQGRVIHMSEEEALLLEPQLTPDVHGQAVAAVNAEVSLWKPQAPADAKTSLLNSLFGDEHLGEPWDFDVRIN